ncbi:MAG: hypothetical protein NUV90_03110 [Candidatus Parcubacteria bacterium]|nr:hypothetical protein [Candidatus Parcubacteria bacterium]
MKKAKKSKVTKEPTISEVMGAVQDLTGAVQTGFAKVEKRFNKIEDTVERHESLLISLVDGQNQLRERVSILDQRVSKTQNRVEDIADSLGDITRVADRDRVSTIDHERRIRHLEKTRA